MRAWYVDVRVQPKGTPGFGHELPTMPWTTSSSRPTFYTQANTCKTRHCIAANSSWLMISHSLFFVKIGVNFVPHLVVLFLASILLLIINYVTRAAIQYNATRINPWPKQINTHLSLPTIHLSCVLSSLNHAKTRKKHKHKAMHTVLIRLDTITFGQCKVWLLIESSFN